MPENYGKRKDDFMPNDLTPEFIAGLTDSQKINIQILQNLTSLNTRINDIGHDVSVHDKLLVTGNGVPSIPERLRVLEQFRDDVKYWSRFIGGALVLQALAFLVGIVVAIVQFLPILKQIADSKP